jgi:hypothetical protein
MKTKKLLCLFTLLFGAFPIVAQERLPQSIAKRVVLKAYLSADHISAATSKTIAVVISKNASAFANPSAGATNATEIANGWYYVDLSTTDTGTLGPLIVRGTCATCDDVEPQPYTIVSANNAGFAGVPDVPAAGNGGLPTTNGTKINQTADLTSTYDAAKTAASSANVATEIQDALRTDSGTELSAVPDKDAPIAQQIQFVYQKIRNEEKVDSTAGTQTISKDDGSVVGTSNISDSGTVFTKGKSH